MLSGYNAVASHVKLNHDIYGSADQSEHISIQSQKRTWSIFAEAYEADARDFGLSCPKYTLTAILQWHLKYQGHDDSGFSQDPSVLCSVTSHVVDLTHNHQGPHRFQTIVQMPEPPFEIPGAAAYIGLESTGLIDHR